VAAFDALAQAVGARLKTGGAVPLLALRIAEFEEIASRRGVRAARALERQTVAVLRGPLRSTLRSGDAMAHREGSDRFAIAMLEPSRHGTFATPGHVRAALERMSMAVSEATGHRVVAGWTSLHRGAQTVAITAAVDEALERTVRDRERRELLATLGHELRAPLTSIRGYLETLSYGGLEEPHVQRFLQTAHRETLALGRMLDGLLEFSLLDLTAPPATGTADVRHAVDDAIAVLAPAARRRGVTVLVRSSAAVAMRVDPAMLGHALRNLLENAVIWSPAGGNVRIAWRSRSDLVWIFIEDDGPGVAPADRERIFDFGVRGDAAPDGGSGIGLAVVRAIAQRAGGDVTASQRAAGRPTAGAMKATLTAARLNGCRRKSLRRADPQPAAAR
jgi:signal transduction histidine kinase